LRRKKRRGTLERKYLCQAAIPEGASREEISHKIELGTMPAVRRPDQPRVNCERLSPVLGPARA
jgi:hypothetical protein